jgi:hypothetical protein
MPLGMFLLLLFGGCFGNTHSIVGDGRRPLMIADDTFTGVPQYTIVIPCSAGQ